jgi:hypothetical protein
MRGMISKDILPNTASIPLGFRTITVDEAVNGLTILIKAGESDSAKQKVINAIGIHEPVSQECDEKIRKALITVAAIRAMGIGQELEGYLLSK